MTAPRTLRRPREVWIGSAPLQPGGGRITSVEVDPDGAVDIGAGTDEVIAPSFLAWHPSGRVVFAVDEAEDGAIWAVMRRADGRPDPHRSRPSGGSLPCHLVVLPSGDFLLTANYGTGTLALHAVDDQGHLEGPLHVVAVRGSGPRSDRQAGPHLHQVTLVGIDVLVTDLGSDRIRRFRVDRARRRLRAIDVVGTPPGSGPRHLVVTAGGNLVHVVGELSGTVMTYRRDGAGALHAFAEVPGGTALAQPQPSELVATPSGDHLLVAHRGDDVVSVLALGGEAGELVKPVDDIPCGGQRPRHIAIVGRSLLVANRKSDVVTRLALDDARGLVGPARVVARVPSPACLAPVPPNGG